MPTLNLIPEPVTVRAVSGASISLRLNLRRKSDGQPFDLTGFTVTAPFLPRDPPSTPSTPPVAAWTVIVELPGSVFLSLTPADSTELGGGSSTPVVWEWAVWIEDATRRFLAPSGSLQLAAP